MCSRWIPISLPKGLLLKPLDNRNGADGNSRFVDLSAGDMHRADFAARCPEADADKGTCNAMADQIRARNRSLQGDWLWQEASADQSRSASPKADSQGDLSSGAIGQTEAKQKADQNNDNSPSEPDQKPILVMPKPAMMPVARQAVKDVTRAQALKGTWLWPVGSRADGRFMAVVRAGVDPILYVNGQPVDSRRLGEQIINNREQAQLLAWYGVPLQNGTNQVEIRTTDYFGNERIMASGVFTQSAAVSRIELVPAGNSLPADGGRSLLPVTIRLLDDNGLPASGTYFATLQASDGRWQEADIQDKEPGEQVRIDQGERRVHFVSGATVGPVTLRVSAGGLQGDVQINQLAAVRPLVAAGLLELGASHGRVGSEQASPGEISAGTRYSKRLATFIKGEIAPQTLLTLAYDSSKNQDTPLFRDVDSNDYYPLAGDASQKGYEAQSRSRLYARVDQGLNSLMWGDYQTDVKGSENNLARIQRKLTGANGVYDNGRTRVQGFAAQPKDRHYAQVIRPNGTAMNYRLENYPIVRNSEVLVLETLDRANGIVLKSRPLTRGRDYTLDVFSGYLSFAEPIRRRDSEGRIQQIRISYDREGDGEAYLLAGARIEQQLNDAVRVGASYTRDQRNARPGTLTGAWVEFSPSRHTTLALSKATAKEWSQEDGDLAQASTGEAMRIRLRQQWTDQARSELTLSRADSGFKNSASGLSEGRQEVRIEHRQQLRENRAVRLEAQSSNALEDSAGYQSSAAGLWLDQTLADSWQLSLGSRYIEQRRSQLAERYLTAEAGVKRRFMLWGREASIQGDYGQGLTGERWRAALQGEWQMYDQVRGC